jgi:antitoxin (DNA-binding transcriptional repressor) of toxin-antitoxin stability system
MKTASIRQVRHDFGTVLDWVTEGEQVGISKRGKIVALLSPPPAIRPARARRRTDLAARLKLRDGDRVIPARAMADILDDNKGAH